MSIRTETSYPSSQLMDSARTASKHNFYQQFQSSDDETSTSISPLSEALKHASGRNRTHGGSAAIPSTQARVLKYDEVRVSPAAKQLPAKRKRDVCTGSKLAGSDILVQEDTNELRTGRGRASTRDTAKQEDCTTFDAYVEMQKQRRQKPLIRRAPVERRIFDGLCFFFVPNDDIARPRRDRIRKVLEHGAVWARRWSGAVTHVVVDERLGVDDVLKALGVERLPAGVKVLKDSYIPWCMQWGRVMNSRGSMYALELPASESAEVQEAELLDGNGEDQADGGLDGEGHTVRDPESSMGSAVHEPPRDVAAGMLARHQGCEDPLAQYTAAARVARDYNLDSDDEVGDEDHEDARASQTSSPEPLSTTTASNHGTYACLKPPIPDDIDASPNARTIHILTQLLTYYTSTSDPWRALAYRKAIAALKRTPTHIASRAAAAAIPGIGASIADKIEEIALTDGLRKLDATAECAADRALALFLRVYGVGMRLASKWVRAGHRTLAEVLSAETLTAAQTVGVERIDDFAQRIPRDEVRACGDFVGAALREIDVHFEVTVGGSYRRGAQSSGDVDLLITRPGRDMQYIRSAVHARLIPLLYERSFLKASLSDSGMGSKWHGACQLPAFGRQSPWRRIDLLLVPPGEMGAALLYFTGNDIFNRSLRLLCRRRGLCLNQHGLFKDVVRDARQRKMGDGTLVEAQSERRIFDVLGVPWREPWERDC